MPWKEGGGKRREGIEGPHVRTSNTDAYIIYIYILDRIFRTRHRCARVLGALFQY